MHGSELQHKQTSELRGMGATRRTILYLLIAVLAWCAFNSSWTLEKLGLQIVREPRMRFLVAVESIATDLELLLMENEQALEHSDDASEIYAQTAVSTFLLELAHIRDMSHDAASIAPATKRTYQGDAIPR